MVQSTLPLLLLTPDMHSSNMWLFPSNSFSCLQLTLSFPSLVLCVHIKSGRCSCIPSANFVRHSQFHVYCGLSKSKITLTPVVGFGSVLMVSMTHTLVVGSSFMVEVNIQYFLVICFYFLREPHNILAELGLYLELSCTNT